MANLTRTRRTRRARKALVQNVAGAALIVASLAILGAWAYLAAVHDCGAGIIESAAICGIIQ